MEITEDNGKWIVTTEGVIDAHRCRICPRQSMIFDDEPFLLRKVVKEVERYNIYTITSLYKTGDLYFCVEADLTDGIQELFSSSFQEPIENVQEEEWHRGVTIHRREETVTVYYKCEMPYGTTSFLRNYNGSLDKPVVKISKEKNHGITSFKYYVGWLNNKNQPRCLIIYKADSINRYNYSCNKKLAEITRIRLQEAVNQGLFNGLLVEARHGEGFNHWEA